MPDGVVIPLRSYRLARRAWLRVSGDRLYVRAPGWWGGREWSVSLSLVAVVEGEPAQETLYAEPIVTPYVYTTSMLAPPNLVLVFSEPLPVPDLRRLVRGQLSAEFPQRPLRDGRPAGRYTDGLLFRAVDPAMAVESLVAAGAARVGDPDDWLRRGREVVTDPAAIETDDRVDRAARRAGRACAGIGAAGVALVVANDRIGDWAGATGTVLAAGAFVVHQALAWWYERRQFRG